MIIYDFIERRLDQVECSNGINDAQYMVDGLWDKNFKKFRQEDSMVNDICKELYDELESIFNPNEDIPF